MRYRQILRTLLATLPLLALPVIAQVPVGYVQVYGNYVGGQTSLEANGVIYFQPVNNAGTAIGYRIGQGYGAGVTATWTSSAITGCSVTAGGGGYTSGATALVATTNGSGGVITLTTSAGVVTGCTVTSGGAYTAAPAVTVVGYGQATQSTLQAQVTNGVFSLLVPDTALTNPANVCFNVTVLDNVSGNSILGAGYSCVQPAGSGTAVTGSQAWCTASTATVGGTCNFDAYPPNLAAMVLTQTGLTLNSSVLSPGCTPTASLSGTSPNYTLGLGICTGATGATGPTGAAGPTGATGPPITFAGPWSSATTYPVGYGVSYAGQSYVALISNTNVMPAVGATWGLLAASGSATISGTVNFPVYLTGSGAATFDPSQGGFATAPLNSATVPQPTVTMPTSGWSGIKFFTDSIGYGTGATSCASGGTCYARLLSVATGTTGNYNNYGVAGDQACDTVKHILNDDSPTTSDLLLRVYETSLNDADVGGVGAYVENFNECQIAGLTWEAIYATNKSLGSAQTPATNWAADTTYSQATGLTTSTYNSPQVWLVPFTSNPSWPVYTSPHMFMWYRCGDVGGSGLPNPGIFTVSFLSSQLSVNTATAMPMLTGTAGTTDAVCYADLGQIGGGTRTLSITTTMVSATGTVVSIIGFGYNDPLITAASGAASPTVWVAGTSRLLASFGGNASATSTYNQFVKNNVQYLNGLGFYNVYFADCRDYWTNIASNSISDGKHPSNVGHQEMANCFLGPTAVPNTPAATDPTTLALRIITSSSNCQLSSTDQGVLFNAGSASFSCLLPTTSVFSSTPNASKHINLQSVGTGVITLVSPYTGSSGVSGTAVGATVSANQGLVIEKDYYSTSIRWNISGSTVTSAAVWTVCKVVTPPYTILDADSDSCLVNGGTGGAYTYPSANTTSRRHVIVNAGSGSDTFTTSGVSGTGTTTTLYPGNNMEVIARSSTLIDLLSQTKLGGYKACSATIGGSYTLLQADECLVTSYGSTSIITLPTTFGANKVIPFINASASGNLTFTGASSGTANGLIAIPGQAGQLVSGASGAWYANLSSPVTSTSSSIGGSALAAGACSTTTVSAAGAATGMKVSVSPATYPGAGFYWQGYVSSAGTVTVAVCAAGAGTPTASTYTVAVN
jgi:hypothetical protein